MNKSDLIAAMAGRAGVSGKDAGACLDALFDVVADVVAAGEEKVNVPGWISFQQTTRKARMGRNPQTGEALHIPESKAVKVSAGSKLKAAALRRPRPSPSPSPSPRPRPGRYQRHPGWPYGRLSAGAMSRDITDSPPAYESVGMSRPGPEHP